MTKAELDEALRLHALWWIDTENGARADLRGADLRGADLRGLTLGGADLRGADLREAYLGGASLNGADLKGAYLRDANLWSANIRGARGIYALDMADPRGYRPVAVEHDDGWRITSGCHWFTVPEALAHWSDPDHPHPEIAARYVRAINALPPVGKDMTDQHTPGPWVVGNRYGSPDVFTADGSLVASTHGEQRSLGRDELRAAQDANARLIAAAPDMLEALRFVKEHALALKGSPMPEIVDAAIAKAEGKD